MPTKEIHETYKDGGIAIIDQWIAAHARYTIYMSSVLNGLYLIIVLFLLLFIRSGLNIALTHQIRSYCGIEIKENMRNQKRKQEGETVGRGQQQLKINKIKNEKKLLFVVEIISSLYSCMNESMVLNEYNYIN